MVERTFRSLIRPRSLVVVALIVHFCSLPLWYSVHMTINITFSAEISSAEHLLLTSQMCARDHSWAERLEFSAEDIARAQERPPQVAPVMLDDGQLVEATPLEALVEVGLCFLGRRLLNRARTEGLLDLKLAQRSPANPETA